MTLKCNAKILKCCLSFYAWSVTLSRIHDIGLSSCPSWISSQAATLCLPRDGPSSPPYANTGGARAARCTAFVPWWCCPPGTWRVRCVRVTVTDLLHVHNIMSGHWGCASLMLCHMHACITRVRVSITHAVMLSHVHACMPSHAVIHTNACFTHARVQGRACKSLATCRVMYMHACHMLSHVQFKHTCMHGCTSHARVLLFGCSRGGWPYLMLQCTFLVFALY